MTHFETKGFHGVSIIGLVSETQDFLIGRVSRAPGGINGWVGTVPILSFRVAPREGHPGMMWRIL